MDDHGFVIYSNYLGSTISAPPGKNRALWFEKCCSSSVSCSTQFSMLSSTSTAMPMRCLGSVVTISSCLASGTPCGACLYLFRTSFLSTMAFFFANIWCSYCTNHVTVEVRADSIFWFWAYPTQNLHMRFVVVKKLCTSSFPSSTLSQLWEERTLNKNKCLDHFPEI